MNKLKKTIFDRNIPFNELPDLPPSESIIDKEILIKWGLASRALAELNKNIMRIPNPLMLVNTISLQEAQSSTAIENIFTTEDELYKAVSDTIKENSANPATKEVLRYREALWGGYNALVKKKALDNSIAIKIILYNPNTLSKLLMFSDLIKFICIFCKSLKSKWKLFFNISIILQL